MEIKMTETKENDVKNELAGQVKKNGKKAVVLMTYNTVEGFVPGTHADGRIIVYSWDKRFKDSRCRDAAKSITDRFYEDFNLRKDAQLFEHIFVYAGINAIDEAIQAARMIGHDWKNPELDDSGKRVTLVACDCDLDKKRRAAHDSYTVDMILCGCGGDVVMGKIAKQVAEGVNPKLIGDYGKLRV
jgi:hypothetical protein